MENFIFCAVIYVYRGKIINTDIFEKILFQIWFQKQLHPNLSQ